MNSQSTCPSVGQSIHMSLSGSVTPPVPQWISHSTCPSLDQPITCTYLDVGLNPFLFSAEFLLNASALTGLHCQLNPHIRQSSVPQLTPQNPHPHCPLSHNSHLRTHTHTVLCPRTHISEPTPTLSSVPQLASQNPHCPLSHNSQPTPTLSSVPQLTSQNPHPHCPVP